jgi:hypothetical protein
MTVESGKGKTVSLLHNAQARYRAPWLPEALSRGMHRPGRQANHSPQSNAETENAGVYISTPGILRPRVATRAIS